MQQNKKDRRTNAEMEREAEIDSEDGSAQA